MICAAAFLIFPFLNVIETCFFVHPDPFGNYLCQKLLEYSTDEQRSLICESVAQDLLNISLNMHGTRAVQKMIDFLSTKRQVGDVVVNFHLSHLRN